MPISQDEEEDESGSEWEDTSAAVKSQINHKNSDHQKNYGRSQTKETEISQRRMTKVLKDSNLVTPSAEKLLQRSKILLKETVNINVTYHRSISIKTKKRNYGIAFLILCMVVIILSIVSAYFYFSSTVHEHVSETDALVKQFNDEIEKMSLKFPSQEKKTWKVIKAAVKSIMKDGEPKQPAVIGLLAVNGAEQSVKCLAKRLIKSIEKAYNGSDFASLNGMELKNMDDEEAKHHLEDKIKDRFKEHHVFLLEHINIIPAESAKLLHGMCDNDHAPFKKVVYLFTVNLFLPKEAAKNHNIADAWEPDLNLDSRAALESRIGGSKAFIMAEEGEISC